MKDIKNFDYRKENLDPSETYVRDDLGLQIEGWAKFRRRIIPGDEREADKYLKAQKGAQLTKEVKDSYRDMRKSNYQIITNLGYAYEQFRSAKDQENGLIERCKLWYHKKAANSTHLAYGEANLRFNMTVSSLYNHLVSVLDGLSHLIFIIFEPCSAMEEHNYDDGSHLVRKRINWHTLMTERKKYIDLLRQSGLEYLRRDSGLKAIVNIRNHLTHSWEIPHRIPPSGKGAGRWCWPQEAKSRQWLPWRDDPEVDKLHFTLAVIPLIEEHFRHVEKLLDKEVFPDLRRGITKWEENNRVEIKEPISGKTPQEKCERSLQPPTPPLPSAGISDMYLQRDGESA